MPPSNAPMVRAKLRSSDAHDPIDRRPDVGSSVAAPTELQRALWRRSVQAKLTVGSTTDPLESEAEVAADRVLRMAGSCGCGGTCGGCSEEDEGPASDVVRRLPAQGPAAASPAVPESLVSGLGPGRPLEPAARAFFEPRFAHDFGSVRVHSGREAARAARSIDALAFTAGSHVVFRDPSGPSGAAGQRTLAHELAHVVQQGRGRSRAVQRVGAADPVFPHTQAEREFVRRAEEEEKAREAKHQAWKVSHRAEHASYLKTVSGGSIARDIESTRSQLVESRMALIAEASARLPAPTPFPGSPFPGIRRSWTPPPAIPAELAPAYARAEQEVVVVETLLPGNQFTPEDASTARAAFDAFLSTLLPVAEVADRRDQELYDLTNPIQAPRPTSMPCPGSCHTPNPGPPVRAPRPVPVPDAPRLRAGRGELAKAQSEAEWRGVLAAFRRAVVVLDAVLKASVPSDSKAREGLVYAEGLLERQVELQTRFPNAFRIPAVFYPEDKWVDVTDDAGVKRQVANGIPWYFYLTYSDTTDAYDSRIGFTWTLQDVTSPKRPTVRYVLGDTEAYTRAMGRVPVLRAPTPLFKKLNNELIFPEGMLYWTHPDGTADQLRTNEPWSVSKWLGMIGLGIAGLALLLMTGGFATPAVLTGLGLAAAGFGIASTLTELQEKAELGILTPEDRNRAILFIAADLASVFTLGLGGFAAKAGKAALATGRVTRMTVLIMRAARTASAVDKLLGAAVLVTVSADFVEQYRTIQNSNLPDADKEKALMRLAFTGLMTGAMTLGPHALGRRKGGHPADAPGTALPEAPAPHPANDVTVQGHDTQPGTGWSKPRHEVEFSEWSRKQETLKPDQAARELEIAQQEGRQLATPNHPEFSLLIEHGGHIWGKRRDGKGWCRSSKRVCYTNLFVGVHSEAERVSPMTTVTEVRQFLEAELRRAPASARTDQGRLDWADYSFYAQRRLTNIAEALAAGKTPPPPPRTFKSFLEAHPPGSPVRNEIKGTRFERKVQGVFKDVVAPERIDLVKPQHHISESTAPTVGKGELTRPDVMFPSPTVKGETALTNKSRSTFVDASPVEARTQVRADLDEAVRKHSGVQQVRRTGDEVDITRIWLMYDAASVPPRLRGAIRDEVRKFQRQYKDTRLKFEVFFV